MIRNLLIRTTLALALAVLLPGCATNRAGIVYEGKIEKDILTFSCDSSSMTNSPCRLTPGSRDVQALRFSNQRTQYSHLLKQGVDVVAKNPKGSAVTSDSDVALLRSLALDECHPAETTNLWSGDLLQLCIPSDPSAVVLFVRGSCDRCNFEPIVLKNRSE
jgi:hypothetical protein